jgi:hypothetical protein
MKTCPYCGKQYSDEVETCPADQHTLRRVGEVPASDPPDDVELPKAISPQEQRFWERMTFRQFAILMIRIQALWLFFYAALDVLYVPRYFRTVNALTYSGWLIDKRELFTLLLRILMNIAAGVLIIQKTERLLSWIVKDCVAEQPPKPGRADEGL